MEVSTRRVIIRNFHSPHPKLDWIFGRVPLKNAHYRARPAVEADGFSGARITSIPNGGEIPNECNLPEDALSTSSIPLIVPITQVCDDWIGSTDTPRQHRIAPLSYLTQLSPGLRKNTVRSRREKTVGDRSKSIDLLLKFRHAQFQSHSLSPKSRISRRWRSAG